MSKLEYLVEYVYSRMMAQFLQQNSKLPQANVDSVTTDAKGIARSTIHSATVCIKSKHQKYQYKSLINIAASYTTYRSLSLGYD